jgi:hypothetical protein
MQDLCCTKEKLLETKELENRQQSKIMEHKEEETRSLQSQIQVSATHAYVTFGESGVSKSITSLMIHSNFYGSFLL